MKWFSVLAQTDSGRMYEALVPASSHLEAAQYLEEDALEERTIARYEANDDYEWYSIPNLPEIVSVHLLHDQRMAAATLGDPNKFPGILYASKYTRIQNPERVSA